MEISVLIEGRVHVFGLRAFKGSALDTYGEEVAREAGELIAGFMNGTADAERVCTAITTLYERRGIELRSDCTCVVLDAKASR